MNNWKATCLSCGRQYEVEALSESAAIEAAKAKHEREMQHITVLRCDQGPVINHAFNLTHPAHPCAPKKW